VLEALDSGISVCLAAQEDAVATPVEQLLELRDALYQLLCQGSNDPGLRQNLLGCLTTLRLIVGNVFNLPDAKYKRLNTKGTSWQKLRVFSGAEVVLRIAGFQRNDDDSAFVIPAGRLQPALLYLVFEILDLCIQTVDLQLYSNAQTVKA
jgi:hypothetical protein